MDGVAMDRRVDQAVQHRLGGRPDVHPRSGRRTSGDGGRRNPGEQVGCLIGGEEPRQVNDAGLLFLGPGHGLEETDAGLDAGVEEEQERNGEEVEGIAGGADGTREIESVEEAEHLDVGVERAGARGGRHHREGETATRGGGPAVGEEGGEVAGAEEGRGRDLQVEEGSRGGGGEVAVGVGCGVHVVGRGGVEVEAEEHVGVGEGKRVRRGGNG